MKTGAIAALKGYRVQALYSINRILNSSVEDVYHPEGKEDLDIKLGDGNEVYIQIKNLGSPLSLSNLIDKKKNYFLNRCLAHLRKNPEAKFYLVSFGQISDSLLSLFSAETSDEKFAKKLKEYSQDLSHLSKLKASVEFITCLEKEVYDSTLHLLKKSGLNSDPLVALDILHFWIYQKSERSEEVTKAQLIKKIADIGKFEIERAEYLKHIHISIQKIVSKDISPGDRELHRQQFYKGLGARYEHILSNADIVRQNFLDQIEGGFSQNNVVVVHAASGQGKSAIAYRYIRDYYFDHLSFQIVLSGDITTTMSQIAALKSIAATIDIPFLIYLDVPPGNTTWVRFLAELGASSLLRFLITVREEDWNKAPGKGADFDFFDIDIEFNEVEARVLYHELTEIKPDYKFTNFDEAWNEFGGAGPLLEFTFLVTQGRSLKVRLAEQFKRIDSQSLEIVRIVSFADQLSARIDSQKIRDQFIELQKTVVELENEFLIRVINQTSLIGLHPVRSSIATSILIDDTIFSSEEYVGKCLEFIDERDRYQFLVNSFAKYKLQFKSLSTIVYNIPSDSWAGRLGLFKALVWIGISDYVKRNNDVFLAAFELLSDAWYTGVKMNFAEFAIQTHFLENTSIFNDETKEMIRAIVDKQTSPDEIFDYARQWINSTEFKFVQIRSDRDGYDFGEFLFWLKQLNSKDKIEFNADQLDSVVDDFQLQTIAQVLLGLSTIADPNFLSSLESKFILKFRQQYRIAKLHLDLETINVNFLIDPSELTDRKIEIHDYTLEIIDLIRKAFPDRKYYKTQGYGHRVTGLPDVDNTTKNIPRSNLPLPEIVELNIILINLFERQFRPEGWNEYIDAVLEQRKNHVAALKKFTASIIDYQLKFDFQKRKDFLVSWELYVKKLKAPEVFFPKRIVDGSGIYSERSGSDKSHQLGAEKKFNGSTLWLRKMKKYRRSYFNYATSLSTSLSHALKYLIDQFQGVEGNEKRLSLWTGQESFKSLQLFQSEFEYHYGKFLNQKTEYVGLKTEELHYLNLFLGLWRHVLNGKSLPVKNFSKFVLNEFETVRQDFQRRLKKSINKTMFDHGWTCFILENRTGDGCFIVLNLNDPMEIFDAITKCALAIFESVGGQDRMSTKGFMLAQHYSKFILIPAVIGKIVARREYHLPLHIFQVEQFVGLNWYHLLQHDLDEFVLIKYKCEVYEDYMPGIKKLLDFMEQYTVLTLCLSKFSQVYQLESSGELDETGTSIITVYGQQTAAVIEKSYSSITTYLGEHCNDYANASPDSISQDDLEFIQVLRKAYDALRSDQFVENDDAGNTIIRLRDFQTWHEKLLEVASQFGIIYLYALKKEIFGLWRS